jgi:hypothetical protein
LTLLQPGGPEWENRLTRGNAWARHRDQLEALIAATLLFVHGTGVRKPGFDRSVEAIRAGCSAASIQGVSMHGISWGERLGARGDLVDETLPAAVTRALRAPLTPEDEEAARWEILVGDPLFELRVAASGPGDPSTGISVGQQLPETALLDKVRAVADEPLEAAGLAGVDAEELEEAISLVSTSDELEGAARAATQAEADEGEFAAAAARAIVAVVLAAHEADPPGEAPPIVYDARIRTDLVDELATRVGPGSTRGFGGWLGRQVGGFVARRATTAFENRREKLSIGSLPFLGDILYYQKRGDAIRDFVAQEVSAAQKPVVALGHSLGGIILVDLLTREDPPEVDRLVTVGSQSPLLYAIDALDRIRRGNAGADPAPFTPWLNIYDRADFLSFIAKPVFSGIEGIRDEEISSRVPFPSSHSAYFHQPRTFELIRDFLPA